MHYHAEVWIESEDNVEGRVAAALARYDENLRVERVHENGETYWRNPDGLWDFWQIGGRWKGAHVPGYDPDTDPSHMIDCDLCDGTGDRPGWVYRAEDGSRQFKDEWAEECNGCNGCQGTGHRLEWPTRWNPHPLDVIPIGEAPADLHCYTLFINGSALQTREWNTKTKTFDDTTFDGKVLPELERRGVTGGFLVTVDYHS